MAAKRLTCDSLGDLGNGTARAIVDAAIKAAVRDLDERGEEDGKERAVSITIRLQKKDDLTVATVDAAAKLPPFRSFNTAARVKLGAAGAHLLFQEHDAENPDQGTFTEMDGGEAGE